MVNEDVKFMQRALDLSLKGSGHVNPNPMVGAVLVKDGKVIGEGYHKAFGGHHAEVNAIRSAGGNVEGATLYVTLEPCNHHGKTPPCTQRIISDKIGRVVFGMTDPNPSVEGNGGLALEKAGIEVTGDVLSEKIKKVNEAFIKHTVQKVPFVTLKTAMTLDGKIATKTGASKWITGPAARARVHEMRHQAMAILAGVDTIIHDDPRLTDRSGHSQKSHPLRVVVDSSGRIPLTARVLDTSETQTMVAVTENAPQDKLDRIKQKGARVMICPAREGRVDLAYLMAALGSQGIDSVLLEGGGTLNYSALREGIVDKMVAFIAPKVFGGSDALSPVEGRGIERVEDAIDLQIEKIERFDEDMLVEAYIIKK